MHFQHRVEILLDMCMRDKLLNMFHMCIPCPCSLSSDMRPALTRARLTLQVVRVDAGDTVFLCMCGQSSVS